MIYEYEICAFTVLTGIFKYILLDEICCILSPLDSISSGIGLVLYRWQAINYVNNDPIYRSIYTLVHNKLTFKALCLLGIHYHRYNRLQYIFCG